MDAEAVLRDAAERAITHLAGLDERPVRATATLVELRHLLSGPLPDGPVDPVTVVAELADAAGDGIVGTTSRGTRHQVLADVGWDVEERGLTGAPRVRIVVGEHRHVTVERALRYLGFGTATIEVVAADGAARMNASELARMRATVPAGPTIVCARVGEVNTGAIDPVADISRVAHDHGAWVHVDGAFGLRCWAPLSASSSRVVKPQDHGSEGEVVAEADRRIPRYRSRP